MHLQEGGAPREAPRPAASTGSLPTASASMLCSISGAEGSPPGAGAAMQCTPRSESRTPSVQQQFGGGGGGGGGGQASVHSGPRQHRLAAHRPTPTRLLDALNLQPTSPSDPGLEGQLDLRKARRGEGVLVLWRACAAVGAGVESRLGRRRSLQSSSFLRSPALLACISAGAGHTNAEPAEPAAEGRGGGAGHQPPGAPSAAR